MNQYPPEGKLHQMSLLGILRSIVGWARNVCIYCPEQGEGNQKELQS